MWIHSVNGKDWLVSREQVDGSHLRLYDILPGFPFVIFDAIVYNCKARDPLYRFTTDNQEYLGIQYTKKQMIISIP